MPEFEDQEDEDSIPHGGRGEYIIDIAQAEAIHAGIPKPTTQEIQEFLDAMFGGFDEWNAKEGHHPATFFALVATSLGAVAAHSASGGTVDFGLGRALCDNIAYEFAHAYGMVFIKSILSDGLVAEEG